LNFPDRVIAIDRALSPIPHAFGGALAFAYYGEPRGTIDIDVNVFVDPARFDAVADRLRPIGVTVTDEAATLVARDGQARVFWDETPIDLFFAYDPLHDAFAKAVRSVPFADTTIPILSASHLVACKALFNRSKDWVDIESILDYGTAIDAAEVLRWVGRVAGDTDPRYDRIAALLTT
jgi:hypothetical protein